MSRKLSRELAMKLVYQLELQKEDREDQIALTLSLEPELTKTDKEYIENVVNGVYINIKNLDEVIEKNAVGWELGRISKVDLSILRLSTYEILYRPDIPLSVAINEAVDLAKKFSGPDSGSFVNAILAKLDETDATKDEVNT